MKLRAILLSAAAMPFLHPAAARADDAGATAAQPIVVTASMLDQATHETATSVQTLSGDDLVHRRQATLGETLAALPGINFDNFGGGASRPVIRGQTAPRIKALSDGSSIQDASAISPDHAIATEPLLLRGIEILRGPATLLYGGSAIGGAVNLLDEKVPTVVPENDMTGVAEGRLGTADDERTLVGGLTAGAGNFAVHVEGVSRSQDDYRVPKSFGEKHVEGSYNDSSSFSAGGSWIGNDGYLGIAYTRQRSEYGLPGHSHEYESCHPHGSSLHCGGHGHDDGDHDHGHDHGHEHEHEDMPYVKLRSDRFDIRGEYRNPLPGIERARLRMSFTDYEHDELEHGEVATTFKNKAHDLRFEFAHTPLSSFSGVIGAEHSSSDFSALGTEAFLPESETRNTALFAMETFETGPVRFELAARQEWQRVETTQGREATHRPFSVSGAAVWDFTEGYSLALSLARSQRAPNVQELYARGIHLATNTYELGTATLGKETSRSIDLTLRKTTGLTTFTLAAYHQDFDDYIFADTLDRYEDFRLIRYTAADARFTGIEGEVTHAFSQALSATVFGDYVRGKLRDGLGNLPRIPAGRLGARVKGSHGPLSGELEYYHVFKQTDVAAFETETGGYDMVNMTIAYKLDLKDNAVELFVRGTNLTNELAFNHASFIKDASPLRGRNFVFGVRAAF